MHTLADVTQLTHSSVQLPVSWYLDTHILKLEKNYLFDQGPGYVGHENMLPNLGDYYVLDWMDGAKVLINNENGIQLLSNICRHRQSLLLKGNGNTRNIVCPVHRWTYDIDGRLIGAPHFSNTPCLSLGDTPLQNWNGMLFAGKRNVFYDMANLSVLSYFDFSGYLLERVQIKEYPCNWKTFIEVYLEDYHVESYHPGLNNFVNTDELKWEFSDWYSVQTVGVNRAFTNPGTPAYAKWHEQVLRQNSNGVISPYGAIWVLYYPNIMLEWYPHVLIISTLLPTGTESCKNVVEFYYPEDIVLFEPEFVKAEQAAYNETAEEDNSICKLITAGRRALNAQGLNESGPYLPKMEDGMANFHKFIRQKIEPHISKS